MLNIYVTQGIKDPLNQTFKAAHHLLRSHAKAYQTYVTKFKSAQKGML